MGVVEVRRLQTQLQRRPEQQLLRTLAQQCLQRRPQPGLDQVQREPKYSDPARRAALGMMCDTLLRTTNSRMHSDRVAAQEFHLDVATRHVTHIYCVSSVVWKYDRGFHCMRASKVRARHRAMEPAQGHAPVM